MPESIAAKVRIGDSADVHVQATGEHFTGKVTRFTDALDPSTRTMQVEIDVPNPNYHLQPGMYADVTLIGRQPPECADRSDRSDPAQRRTRQACWCWMRRTGCSRARWKSGVESSNNVQILGGLQRRRARHRRQSGQLSAGRDWLSRKQRLHRANTSGAE